MWKLSYYRSISFIFLTAVFIFTSCEKEDKTDNDNNEDQDNNNFNVEALEDGNFEDWKIHTEGEVSYEVPASGWWGSLNMLKTLGCPLTMTKTEDAYQGVYALRLETILWGDELTIPGIISAGYFDPEEKIGENLILGRSFSKAPQKITGYYKYYPATKDTAVFYTNLTRFDTVSNVTDTIAEGTITINDSIKNYTKFELQYDYFIKNQKPDTINLLFLTSISGQTFQGHVGSTLYIDDVKFVYANNEK